MMNKTLSRKNLYIKGICLTVLAIFLAIKLSIASDRIFIRGEIIKPDQSVIFYDLEVAHLPALREQGLMNRTNLPSGQGMLFVWPDSAVRLFWMKNTVLPLDLLFFDAKGRLVHIYQNATPGSVQTISSFVPVKYVIELNAGSTARHQVKLDSYLVINDVLPDAQ